MNILANKISDYLVNKGLDPEQKEIYAYALECLFNSALPFGIILIVGAIFNEFLITFAWMVFFLPIRHTSGGLHANSHTGCLILSLSIGIGCFFLNALLVKIAWIIWPGILFSVLVIFLCSPVIHKNHPLSEQRKTGMKRASRKIVIAESILIIIIYILLPEKYPVACILGLLSATISTLIGYCIEQAIRK